MSDELRAIDCAISEQVFGLRVRHRADAWSPALAWDVEVRPGVWSSQLPHYSTSIAAAWLVVDAMQARGFAMGLDMEISAGEPLFSLLFYDGHTVRGDATAATAPLATCRAALQAVGAPTEPASVAPPVTIEEP